MRCNLFVGGVVIALAGSVALGQVSPASDPDDTRTRETAGQLIRELRARPDSFQDVEVYKAARDVARLRVVEVVDEYLTRPQPATAIQSDAMQRRLREVLGEHRPNAEYGDAPRAWVTESRYGKALIAVYNLIGTAHDSEPEIRGYVVDLPGKFRLAAMADDDFASHTVHASQIQSGLPGECWILVWGPREGFNGTLIRTRVYAFDGNAFRTIWAPEDMQNAEIVTTPSGLSISHVIKAQIPWESVVDDYRITADGGVLISRKQVAP